MGTRQSIQLGAIEETMLIPLYARAVETLKKRPVLKDVKAVEMVEAIDWDFRRIHQTRRLMSCILRTAAFDEFVKEFLSRHPEGTVVEIGAGLNTRFERLDNGTVHWFDLDLPDAVALRQRFLTDSGRRTTLSASVIDPGWIAAVGQSPGPYCFVAEAVFLYLHEQEVKTALAQIAASFPHASIVFDSGTLRVVTSANKDHAHRRVAARFVWACQDPMEIEGWKIGLHLRQSRTIKDAAEMLGPRLSWPVRTTIRVLGKLVPRQLGFYRISLFVTE